MMNTILIFGLLLSLFALMFYFMHAYAYYRLCYLFHLPRFLIFYIGIFFVTLLFPFVNVMERVFDGPFWRVIYTLTSVGVGVIFILFCLLLIQHLLSLVLDMNRLISGITILALVFVISSYALVNGAVFDVKEIDIKMPNLDQEVTAVQLSDIHVGTIHNSDFLERIVQKTNALNPDVVFITGDLVDGSGKLTQASFAHLNELKAKTFFVTGNHETYANEEEVLSWIVNNNVTVLRNEVVEYKGIQLIGMDNPSSEFYGNGLNLTGINIKQNKPTILLHHIPIDLNEVQGKGINLVLSGHTHNGQIFPFNWIVKLFYLNTNGLYSNEETQLYVSPGTGTWGPPMRLGSQNEITVFKLKK